jgi:hypothetical protein
MFYLERVLNRNEQKTFFKFVKSLGISPTDVIDAPITAFTCIPSLNIIILDDALAAADAEYDNIECTCRGQKTSMSGYILQKYGSEVHHVITKLL